MTVRRAWIAVLIAFVLSAAGCGQVQESPGEPGLDVLLTSASIRNGDGVTVEILPAGTLHAGQRLATMLLAKAEREVSISGLVTFTGRAKRVGGGTDLGVTGICGYGWTEDGKPNEQDPCAGAEPAFQLPAGQESILHLGLSSVTPAGQTTPGTYRISIPLNDRHGPVLDLTYRVVERGQAELPPWSSETIPLAISFENQPPEAWSELLSRVEDGYGRVIDERELSVYKDEHADQEKDGIFTVDVPRNLPLKIILLQRDGHDWKPCSSSIDFVTSKRKWPLTLLIGDCGAKA